MTRREFVGSVIALMAAWLVGRRADLRRMLTGIIATQGREIPVPLTVYPAYGSAVIPERWCVIPDGGYEAIYTVVLA